MMEQLVEHSVPDSFEKKKRPSYMFSREFGNLMQHILDRFTLQEEVLSKIRLQLEVSSDTFHANVEQGLNDFTNRLNNSMNLFAAIATMFLPLTLISGIFGMNVTVPWQKEENQLWPFWVLLGIMAGIFFVILIWLKCKHWI